MRLNNCSLISPKEDSMFKGKYETIYKFNFFWGPPGFQFRPNVFFNIYKRLTRFKFYENYNICWWYSSYSNRQHSGKITKLGYSWNDEIKDTANNLSLNKSKSTFMLITNKHASSESFVTKVNNNHIERTLTHKYLLFDPNGHKTTPGNLRLQYQSQKCWNNVISHT